MSYLDRIAVCNNYNPSDFLPLSLEGRRIGSIHPSFLEYLSEWSELFQLDDGRIELFPQIDTFEGRSQEIEEVVKVLIARKRIHRWHGERYPVVVENREEPLFLIDRASVSYFGFKAFGQHLNGYVRENNKVKMWLARRAMSKWHEPGRLDNMVAGGLPYGISLTKNLVKECWEEAAIPPDLAGESRAIGSLSYTAQTPRGLKPDTIYCYDLELPVGFVPRCTDGEVDSFELLPIQEVAEIVFSKDEVKKNSNLVIIDFLLRHQIIKPDHPEYIDLVEGLNRGESG